MYELLQDPTTGKYFVLLSLIFFGGLELLAGHYANTKRTKNDWMTEILGFFLLAINSFIVLFGILYIGNRFFPGLENSLADLSLWVAVPLYMFVDDIAQYWFHRSAHEYNFLWKHHRPHHAAKEMGVMVSYRNSWIYFLFLPNIWWASMCTFTGMIPATVIGLIIKQFIVASSHSTVKWDEYINRIKFLSPLMWVVERIIITPSFHYAHHGKTKSDGISDPNGNFGNAFSIWDQMFGTATFTRKYPSVFGLQSDPVDSWSSHLFYPIVASNKPDSEISRGYQKLKTTTNEPIITTLAVGKHLYCQCGYSKTAPFCDGSHNGTKIKPLLFEVHRERKMKICNCKKTKNGPYCDDSHLS